MKTGTGLAAAAVFALATGPAVAGRLGPPVTRTVGDDDTQAFVGLNFSFGATTRREAVLGLAYLDTDDGGDSTGAKFSVHFDFDRGFSKTKLTGLVGDPDVQAEIGGGYDIIGRRFFASGGLSGDYIGAGADLYPGTGLSPYIGLHTLHDFDSEKTETTHRPIR